MTAGGGISYEHTKMQNILTYFGIEYCIGCINSSGVSSGASRKVACLIPVGVIGIFHGLNPSGLTMILGSNER
jgi:ribosomal protein S27E